MDASCVFKGQDQCCVSYPQPRLLKRSSDLAKGWDTARLTSACRLLCPEVASLGGRSGIDTFNLVFFLYSWEPPAYKEDRRLKTLCSSGWCTEWRALFRSCTIFLIEYASTKESLAPNLFSSLTFCLPSFLPYLAVTGICSGLSPSSGPSEVTFNPETQVKCHPFSAAFPRSPTHWSLPAPGTCTIWHVSLHISSCKINFGSWL